MLWCSFKIWNGGRCDEGIYKNGRCGETSIIGGRVPKDDPRIEAYGTIDELNSFVGQAVCLAKEADFEELYLQLVRIQHELFDCGSDLAYARPRRINLRSAPSLWIVWRRGWMHSKRRTLRWSALFCQAEARCLLRCMYAGPYAAAQKG